MKNNSFFNRELVNKLISNVGVALWVWDINYSKVYYNEVFYDLTGHEIETGKIDAGWWESVLHPGDKKHAMKAIDDFVSGKTDTYDVECRVIKKNGDIIWVLDSGKRTNLDGSATILCGTTQEITKRKIYEEKLQLAMDFADFSIWECDVVTKEVEFESNYLKSLGYEDDFFDSNVENWMNIVHKDDFKKCMDSLQQCFDGKTFVYDEKTRIRRSDGEYIWVRDVGEVVTFDTNGKPLKMLGGRININQHETDRIKLEKYQEKLKLAMDFADFSIWECDVVTKEVKFESNYLKSLGYEDDFFDSNVENWLNITHPYCINEATTNWTKCFDGKQHVYDQKTRIKKANGEYFWIHDIGEVIKYDENGKPLKMLGGRINIDQQEKAKLALEEHQEKLEDLIEQRTIDLLRRDTVLLELNQMSQKLMATPQGENFNSIVYECLNEFSIIGDNARFSIFRHKNDGDQSYCYLASNNGHTYKKDFDHEYLRKVFKDVSISFVSEGKFAEDEREEFYDYIVDCFTHMNMTTINYKSVFPTIYDYVEQNKILNVQTYNLSPIEIIYTKLQGIQSILVAPINISNKPWGFIALDYFEKKTFSEDDEKMLSLVGSVLAQAIHKNEFEILAKEAQEHNKLMIDSIPLCCNLWQDGVNISTNDEAVRLFELESQEEYLEKFHLLSPEYQPDGRKSIDRVAELVNQAIKKGSAKFEWMHQKLDGEKIPCEITLMRIPHRDHYYVSGCTRDLREFKALIASIEKTQEDLRQAHEEAMLSSQAKSNFLANMSHEIRTPMNAISGMTDIILRDTIDNEVRENALNIKRASDSLLSIINDVLDISKIESGKLDIVEGEYCLSNVLKDVLTIANNRLEDKNLMLITNFQHDLPDKIIGDDIRIKQIIVNIVNNAIKFTEKGSINFTVSGEYVDGLVHVTFAVTDTGMGISKEDIEKLFIEFERVNTTKNRSIEGTGLGLAISKRLCEMMNGHFKVESELNVGSTFSVTVTQKYEEYVPLAKVEEDKSALVFESRGLYLNSLKDSFAQLDLKNVVFCSSQSEFNEALYKKEFDFIFTTHMYVVKAQERVEQKEYKSKIILLADNDNIKSKYNFISIVLPVNTVDIANVLNGKSNIEISKTTANNFISPDSRVLVVDDNIVNLKVAQGLLAPYKFTIDTAEDGLQAIEKVQNNIYDIVFMDHMMPGMDGIDATIKIRSFDGEYYQKLPIVALTANAIVGTREMFLSEGMNDFIAKPIKLSALNEVLAKWLPVEKQLSIDYMPVVEVEVDTAASQKLKQIKIKAIDTKLGVQRVGGNIDDYIDILNMYYKDGLKRVISVANLFQANKLADYKIEVHALKSASASIGAVDISKQALLLEEAVLGNNKTYVSENTQKFLNDLNDLLANIGKALEEIIVFDNSDKEPGDIALFNDTMPKLITALDEIDLTECDSMLEELLRYSWGDEQTETINKIKDAVDSYEFDDAIEVIKGIL